MNPDQLNSLIQDFMSRFNQGSGSGKTNEGTPESIPPPLTPQKALVIIGLLTGVLLVDSVLVDRNQAIEIVLVGSMKKKTQMEKVFDQLGSMPFDEVLKGFMGRLF